MKLASLIAQVTTFPPAPPDVISIQGLKVGDWLSAFGQRIQMAWIPLGVGVIFMIFSVGFIALSDWKAPFKKHYWKTIAYIPAIPGGVWTGWNLTKPFGNKVPFMTGVFESFNLMDMFKTPFTGFLLLMGAVVGVWTFIAGAKDVPGLIKIGRYTAPIAIVFGFCWWYLFIKSIHLPI